MSLERDAGLVTGVTFGLGGENCTKLARRARRQLRMRADREDERSLRERSARQVEQDLEFFGRDWTAGKGIDRDDLPMQRSSGLRQVDDGEPRRVMQLGKGRMIEQHDFFSRG